MPLTYALTAPVLGNIRNTLNMLIKSADNKDEQIAELERLLAIASREQEAKIIHELRATRAGIKSERDTAYLIDFHLKDSKNTIVIHDLRLDVGGRIAQIDHLLLHRTLTAFVLETKHFHAGLKISEEGEFLRWNDYKKSFEGMASPLAQNERHIVVLKDAFAQIDMPTRLGLTLSPTYESYILVSPNSRIDRPKKFDTKRIIKADMLMDEINRRFNNESLLDTITSMGRFVSSETIQDIANKLIALHRPAHIDYAAKFGMRDASPMAVTVKEPATDRYTSTTSSAERHKPACRNCGGDRLSLLYGKYGYYFKCAQCTGNTPIKIGCGTEGHKERIRKEGNNFFRECALCRTSSIFFINPQSEAD